MKNDKFQENLSRPGVIDAKARYRAAARRLKNTNVASGLVGRMAVNERVRIFENPFVACVSVHHGVLLDRQENKKKSE